jgi:hypothetical protein
VFVCVVEMDTAVTVKLLTPSFTIIEPATTDGCVRISTGKDTNISDLVVDIAKPVATLSKVFTPQ